MLTATTLVVALSFAAEYALRLYLAPLDIDGPDGGHAGNAGGWPAGAMRRRVQWACSPLALIDLLAAAPLPLALAFGAPPATARIYGMLWILKLVRYTPAFELLIRVVRTEARALSGVTAAFLIALLLFSTAEYLLERNSGAVGFDSLPGALWWTIVTVSTTGYGDEVPVTVTGRVIGAVAMICGIATFALLAGILAGGFARETRRRDFLESWNLVAGMPLFAALGAATIAEVAMLLRPQELAAGRTVVRKGQPGDSMYFVARGGVDVHAETGPVRLGAGGFFGEMALISGGPRTATVVTHEPTTLLKLDIVDFRSLLAHQPDLMQLVHAEAARRAGGSAADAEAG